MTRDDYVSNKTYGIDKILIANGLLKLDESIGSLSNLCSGSICNKCGGDCCKKFPCVFAPFDLKDINDPDYMHAILDIGLLSVSKRFLSTEKDDYFYLVRPMSNHDKGHIVSDNICLEHRDNSCRLFVPGKGCMFETEFRPTGGLLLLPVERECLNLFSASVQEKLWGRYQESLKALAREYSSKRVKNYKEPVSYDDVKKLEKVLLG